MRISLFDLKKEAYVFSDAWRSSSGCLVEYFDVRMVAFSRTQ